MRDAEEEKRRRRAKRGGKTLRTCRVIERREEANIYIYALFTTPFYHHYQSKQANVLIITSFLRVPVFEGVGVGVEDIEILGEGANEIDDKKH